MFDNTIIYNINKSEAVGFPKACQPKLIQLFNTKFRVNNKTVLFKKEPIQWLEIWLDKWVNFLFHINKKIKKAKVINVQIIGLSKTYGLCPELVSKMWFGAIQFITLYKVEL